MQESGKKLHTWGKGHGRLEERRIRTTTVLNPLFTGEWAGIGQAFAVRRRVTHSLKCTQQVVYGISSLTPEEASPARLLDEARALIGTSKIVLTIAVMSRWGRMLLNCGPLGLLWLWRPQWHSARAHGLAARWQCAPSNAALLRQTSRSARFASWPFAAVTRDLEKALG